MNTRAIILPQALLLGCCLSLTVGCHRKINEAAQQAQEVAKTADDRVSQLEKELADLKAGKNDPQTADRETVEHVSKSHQKALERQIAEAKQHAAEKHQEAAVVAAAPPPPKEAPKPIVLEVPASTKLEVKLAKDLATDKEQPGDAWEGTLAAPISVNGQVVWPAGTPVHGVITQSTAAGRLSSGQGGLGIKLTVVGHNDVDSGVYLVTGTKRGERNAKFIGGTAALGALVGMLTDRKNQGDHALGGAAIGAAAGTALAAGTADTIIRIPADQPMAFTLTAPERVILKP